MNNQNQIQLRQQLCLMTDAYIQLTDNPVWLEMVAAYPELEALRLATVDNCDSLWYAVRSRIVTQGDM